MISGRMYEAEYARSVGGGEGLVPISRRAALRDGRVWIALAAFWLVHAALWLAQPDIARKLLLGDRAGDRLKALDQLIAADGIDQKLGVVFRIGSPGDWLPFLPAYATLGPAGIVLQSMVLYSAALVAIAMLARRIVGPGGVPLALGAWILLPSTLFHPHALVTETICNPLMAMLLATLVALADADRPRLRLALLAGAITAVLVMVRHVFLLLPFAVALWLILFRPRGVFAPGRPLWRPLARYVAMGFALLGIWWAVLAIGQFRYAPGESVGGLQSNLFLRAERMAYLGHVALPESYTARAKAMGREPRLMPATEFVGYAVHHPVLFARTAAADAFNMMMNPGVAMLVGRYLGVFDLGERNHRDLNKWRETREKDGFVGLARLLLETSPAALAINGIGIMAWTVFLGLAAWGAGRSFADATIEPGVRWLLAGLFGYVIVLTSLTAGYTRWDHRTPMDAGLALVFAAGLMDLARRHAGARRLTVM